VLEYVETAVVVVVVDNSNHFSLSYNLVNWHTYLSGARCRSAYGPADATATTVSCSSKSRLVLPSWFYLSGTSSPG